MLNRLRLMGECERSVLFPKGPTHLHAMVTSAGYSNCVDPRYRWDGLKRGSAPYVTIQHTISGRGFLRYEKSRYEIRPGQTMLLRFPHNHVYWLKRGDHWEFFWLALHGREVLRIWRSALAKCGPLVELSDDTINRLAAKCRTVVKDDISAPARMSAIAYGAAMDLADDLLTWGAASRGMKMHQDAVCSDAIGRAISECHARASDPNLTVDDLASAAGYSRFHFSRLFSESQGVSPGQFITRCRMEDAVQLLQANRMPIKAVSMRCGFNDANYFSKVFQRTYGMTPRQFRQYGGAAAVQRINGNRKAAS